MKTLTLNQLMVLLSVHRGTFSNELQMGTYRTDAQRLLDLGLVQRDSRGQGLETSQPGVALIGVLRETAGAFVSAETKTVVVSHGGVSVCDTSETTRFSRAMAAGLHSLANVHSGSFSVEQAPSQSLTVSDVEGDVGRISGGTFYLVAGADVKLSKDDDATAVPGCFQGGTLVDVDKVLHLTEAAATEVAVSRAKEAVGSRHLVLKAVAMHQVAVPIQSTRL